ncbi:MAG: lysophospholipid acyltransferase family protein [Actinomycetes bacterium]
MSSQMSTDTRPTATAPADPADEERFEAMVPGARSLVRRVVRPLLRTWLRLEVEGLEHLPADGPVLIASTHCSHADSLALGAGTHRPVFFLGDERLTRWPLLGPLLPRLGMVPVQRGRGDRRALDLLGGLLADGHAVVVYPEGSRSRDGRVHRPRSGVARLAAATGVPVVPVAVAGIFEVWPIGRRPRLRGGRVVVRFGAPIEPPVDHPRERRRFNERLHATLADLAGVEAADDYSPVGGGTGAGDEVAA